MELHPVIVILRDTGNCTANCTRVFLYSHYTTIAQRSTEGIGFMDSPSSKATLKLASMMFTWSLAARASSSTGGAYCNWNKRVGQRKGQQKLVVVFWLIAGRWCLGILHR